jgi:hypothetical protein
MNAEQLIEHHDFHELCFDALKEKCQGNFHYVRDNVYLRLIRSFFEYLQSCDNVYTYVKNARLFNKQKWSKQTMSLLKGNKERRVMYGAYYVPLLSFLVENKLRNRLGL